MILFDLKCGAGHVFEAWFRSGDAYEAQAAAREIGCPICGDSRIVKAPMAPRIGKARGDAAEERQQTLAVQARRKIDALRRQIEKTCDYVGDRFAEEARRMHYGEAPRRDIYGEATDSEAEELQEEGVAFARIPWPNRKES